MTTPDSSSLTPGQPLPGTVTGDHVSPGSYPRRADGTVNWRALVSPQSLYVKSEHREKVAKLLNKPVAEIYDLNPEDVKKVPDRFLVIRKAGILELARLRGFVSQIPDVQFASRDYVIVRTVITWTPFENMPLTSGGVGEASPENTTELGSRYLASNAQNRAFARAVRDYLEIDIVCSDELGKDGVEPDSKSYHVEAVGGAAMTTAAAGPTDLSPKGTLERAATEGGFTFDHIKKSAQARWDAAQKNGVKSEIENDPSVWNSFQDIPPRDCLTLTQLIKSAIAARQKVSAAKTEAATTQATTPVVGAAAKVAATRKRPAATKPLATVTPISAAAEPQQAAA